MFGVDDFVMGVVVKIGIGFEVNVIFIDGFVEVFD